MLMNCLRSVKVDLKDKDDIRPPQSFADYTVKVDGWDDEGRSTRFPGVVLHRRVDPERNPST